MSRCEKEDSKLALSVDVEDWFCVRNMREEISFSQWARCESRIRVGMDFLLEELNRRGRRATFFVLGWIAEKFPSLVREIAAEGHEVGSHGYGHHPLDFLSPESFAADLRRSLEILTPLAGKIRGFRAPSFSITRKTWWALEELSRQGLEYDSSIFPVRHPDYGVADFPAGIQRVGDLIEVPLTSLPVGGFRVPVSGGGYFRVAPYPLTRQLLQRARKTQPVVLYFHPWEFDPLQPRQSLPAFKRWRHYAGLSRNREKFRRLLDDFPTGTIEEHIRAWSPPQIDKPAAGWYGEL